MFENEEILKYQYDRVVSRRRNRKRQNTSRIYSECVSVCLLVCVCVCAKLLTNNIVPQYFVMRRLPLELSLVTFNLLLFSLFAFSLFLTTDFNVISICS